MQYKAIEKIQWLCYCKNPAHPCAGVKQANRFEQNSFDNVKKAAKSACPNYFYS